MQTDSPESVLQFSKDVSRRLYVEISINYSNLCVVVVQIRGMPFIFEMNQTRVKMYLDSLEDTNEKQEPRS